jgi:putative transposase
VDQHGDVLDILVTPRRDAKTATRFFRKLLKSLESVPRVLVTDKLASYRVTHRQLISGVEHRRSKYLNNRAENSHQPTRQRERAMKKFRSPAARSGSSRHSAGYHHTSDPAATNSPQHSTDTRWTPASPLGTRSSGCAPPPDHRH